MKIRRRVLVSGRVQGVGFRMATVERARAEGSLLEGFVRNLSDGRVEAVFQGEERSVLAVVAWCAHGPSSARVERVEVIEEALDSGLAGFGVKT